MRNNSKKIITRDSWGRPEGDKWFGFDPERKEYTEKHFTYEDKEARYKKKNDEWFVSSENTDGFVPLKDPRGNRARELERNAKEVKRMSSFEASEKESAEEIAKTRDFRNVVEKGSEIFTGFPGKEKNQYEFRDGNWYEPNPEVEKAIKRAEEDYLPISRIGGGTMTSPTGIGEDFSSEAKSKRSLDAIKDIPKTRVIKDDDRVRALNKQFGKNASLDEDYETFGNYDNSREKRDNKYRVKDGSWERLVYKSEEWSPIENEGSIGALNRRYGKNVEVPKKVKIEEARDISPFLKINKNYLSQTEESAIKKLYKDFNNLGFEFEQEGMLTDYIKVIPKNKDVAPMTFSFDDPKGLDAARLRQYLQSNAEYDSNNSVVNEIRSNVRTNAFNKAIGEDGEVIEGSRADKVGVSKFIDHNNKYYESKEYKDNFKKLNFVEQKEEIERRQMENKPIENKDILPYGDFAVWIGLVDKYQGTPEDLKKLKESEKKLYNSEEYKVIYANKRDEYIKEKKKNNEKLLDAYEIALDSRDPKKIKEAKEKIEAGTFVATIGKNINYVSKQQQDYSDEIKSLNISFKKNDDDYRNRKISAEVYQDRYETLESKRDQLKVVAKEIDTDQKRTKRLTGEYITEKAKYGGFWGNLVNEFIVSADKVAELGVKLDPAEKAKTSKESQIITPEEMKYYKSDALRKGGFTEEEIKNIKINQVKLKSIQQNERMLIEAFGSDLTTEESRQNLGFFQQALVGVAGSLPAMLTRAIPVVGQAASFVSLADLSMSHIEKEMLTDPDFQTTTAFDRAKVSVPYGIVMGALENFGLNRLTKGQSYLLGKGILGNIAKILPAGATREVLENIANKEVKNLIGKGVLKVVAGTLAEGETGAIQTFVADIGIKKAYNYLRAAYNTEEDLKKLTGGEAFSTPKTFMEGLSAVGEGALAEAIGGFAMSTVIVNSQLLINGNLSLYNKEDLNFLEDFTSDEQFKKIIVADLKNKMIQGTMTKSQAESALNDIDLVAGVFNSIDENLPESAKMEAFNLINKRNRLEKEKQGKDPALSKGITDKIKEINDKLTKLPLKVQEFNGKERLKVLEKALKRKRKDKDIIIVEGKKISRTEAETEYKDLDEKIQSIISEFNAPVVETADTKVDIEELKQTPEGKEVERRRRENLSAYDEEELDEVYAAGSNQTIGEFIKAKYDAELNQINQKQKDAVQEQTAGEVPVQPTTEVGEEVVQGEPTAEPQVLTEEGKAEEVESKRIETEAKIKRKDLFSNGGSFSNTAGGSGVDSVPTGHSEINGIEFVQFSNPNTGEVDVIMTGKSDNDFVGFYRIYENGKSTNKWSSKFENQSRNKEDFKTMIGGVQSMLPQGHEYTEKTSISTDGLRLWNQQLNRGYELQYDNKGNLITNRAAINGDAIINELGVEVNKGNFDNISVKNSGDMKKVKAALLPYLQNFGLNESNIHFENGTVEIDLPVLKNNKVSETTTEVKAEEVVLTEKQRIEAEIAKKEGKVAPVVKAETTPQEQVAAYRAEEQAELLKAIPKIESYKVNGKIDKTKMPKTVLAKYNKIYDKYDALISPLLEPVVKAPIATNQGVSITNKSAVDNIKTKTTDKVRVKVIEAAQRAIKTLQSVLPNFDIVIHENEESYNAAMKDRNGIQGSAGNFSYGLDGKGNLTGRIDINLSKASARTVAHEVAHGVMLKTFGDNPALFKRFRDRIASILKESTNKALMDFANQYVDNKTGKLLDVTYEEYLAELTGALAAEEGNLSATTLQKIATLINSIVSKITNGMLKPFEDVKDTKQVIEFFSNIANSIRKGEGVDLNDFNLIGVSGQINSSGIKSKSSINAGEIKRFPTHPNVKVFKDVKISDFDGNTVNLMESDRMVGGYIANEEGQPMFKFFGGVFYPIITGKWWASRNTTKANGISTNANKNRNSDGYIYSSPMIGSANQHMSNNDMLSTTIELMKYDVNNKKSKVTKNDVVSSLRKSFSRKGLQGKKNIIEFVIKNSKTINELFNNLESVMFQEGNTILDSNGIEFLSEVGKPISNFSFEERKQIVETLLGDPKVKETRFPSAGSITEAAKRFEEPITSKVTKIGDIVTVMRTKGELKYRETKDSDPFYHKSYPVEIYSENQDGSPAEIEVYVLDGAYSMGDVFPSLTKSNGGEFTYEEYLKKHSVVSEKLADAQYNRTSKLSYASGKVSSRTQNLKSKSQLASDGKGETEAKKITELNKKRDSAQKNTIGKNPKLGDITSDLGPLLKQVLNINAKLIPEDVFEDYRKVIEMLSGNRRILSPENRAEIEKKLNNIIRSIEFSNNKASDLKGRYDDFKVNNEDLDYSDSIKKMLEDGIISKEEFDFMKKYKSKIIEAEVKQKMTKEEDEDEKEELIAEIKDTTVTADEFKGDEFRLERDFVNKFIETLKNSDLESLNNSDLNDLVKIIYNINNGFVNHATSQMLIKLDSNIKEATLVEAIPDSYGGVVKRIQQWLRTLDVNIANIKLRIKNDKYGVGSNSLFNIDEMFGDFKTKRIFNSIFNESAKAQQTYQSEIKDVQGRLIEAEDAVFNSFKKDGNALIKSQMKSMLYMIQLEYESNEGSKQTRPALAVLDAVIEFAKIKGVTEMSKQDLKVMQDIKKNFVVDGKIDIDKILSSFNKAEISALKVMQSINEEMTKKATFTSYVINGSQLKPLKNYVPQMVAQKTNQETIDEQINRIKSNINPGTESNNLIERNDFNEKNVSPVILNPYFAINQSSKSLLINYHLADPIRTARMTLKKAELNLKENKKDSEAREMLEVISQSYETALNDLLSQNFGQTNKFIDALAKVGYSSMLASAPRMLSEAISNTFFVMTNNPVDYSVGVSMYGKLAFGVDGKKVLTNLNSKVTSRNYSEAGENSAMFDLSALTNRISRKGKMDTIIVNGVVQVYDNFLGRYVNLVSLVANNVVSQPDKVMIKPLWFGSFARRFEKITGETIDFNKIINNDEEYLNKYKDALSKSTDWADSQVVLAGASTNPFMGVLKNVSREDDNLYETAVKNFNRFMNKFMINEYFTIRKGVFAMIGKGDISREDGLLLLAAASQRLFLYGILTRLSSEVLVFVLRGTFNNFADMALGIDDDDEEKEVEKLKLKYDKFDDKKESYNKTLEEMMLRKIINKKEFDLMQNNKDNIQGLGEFLSEKPLTERVMQSVLGSATGMILGRNYGNFTRMWQNYLVEQVNKKYGDDLGIWDGEYDPYKDALAYNPFEGKKIDESTDLLTIISGPYAPHLNFMTTLLKAYNKSEPKEERTILTRKKERLRYFIEGSGMLNMLPFYKDFRKSAMDYVYKEVKVEKQQEVNLKEKKIDILKNIEADKNNAYEPEDLKHWIKYVEDADYKKKYDDKEEKIVDGILKDYGYKTKTEFEYEDIRGYKKEFGNYSDYSKERKGKSKIENELDDRIEAFKYGEEYNKSSRSGRSRSVWGRKKRSKWSK
jgi:hypothetical protein